MKYELKWSAEKRTYIYWSIAIKCEVKKKKKTSRRCELHCVHKHESTAEYIKSSGCISDSSCASCICFWRCPTATGNYALRKRRNRRAMECENRLSSTVTSTSCASSRVCSPKKVNEALATRLSRLVLTVVIVKENVGCVHGRTNSLGRRRREKQFPSESVARRSNSIIFMIFGSRNN